MGDFHYGFLSAYEKHDKDIRKSINFLMESISDLYCRVRIIEEQLGIDECHEESEEDNEYE